MTKNPKIGTRSSKTVVEFERIDEHGERFVPHAYQKDGLYRVADPALAEPKKLAANQIAIRADEILGYLAKGFHLRMRGEISGQINLIEPNEIKKVAL